MKNKTWSADFWHRLQQSMDEVRNAQLPLVAAFDADGTLWDADLGETFFKYQIRNRLPAFLKDSDWEKYRSLKSKADPRPAYLWLAQILENEPIERTRSWAEACVREQEPLPIFEPQRELISFLLQNAVNVFVVTASTKVSVEPGAKLLGIPEENVLGVSTRIHYGVHTAEPKFPVTYKQGKPEALRIHLDESSEGFENLRPFLCVGNSLGDQQLLEAASHMAVAVRSVPPQHELFETEEKLRLLALEKSWWNFQLSLENRKT